MKAEINYRNKNGKTSYLKIATTTIKKWVMKKSKRKSENTSRQTKMETQLSKTLWEASNVAFLLFVCSLFRAVPVAYGSSQARLGVVSELQLRAFATATAKEDPSHICNLHYSL